MKNKIFIGDNLEVMNTIKSYDGKVDLIYIDPPYNTGNNFAFEDDKIEWYDFIKKRLVCAKKMLSESGVIYISIDDNELVKLKMACYDVFGKENDLGIIITKQAQRSNAKHINVIHEYILAFAKNKKKLPCFKVKRICIPEDRLIIDEMYKSIKGKKSKKEKEKSLGIKIKKIMNEFNITWIRNYNNVSPDNKIFFSKDLSTPREPRRVDIPEINLKLEPLKTRGWSSDKKLIYLNNNNRLHFKEDRPYEIHYLEESSNNVPSIVNFYSRQGTEDLKKLDLGGIFDTPKPIELIKYLIRTTLSNRNENCLILDFFGGSGTTAQAVYEINEEDKKNFNYILIQLAESINIKSKAYEKCIEKNIEPFISEVLLKRIDTYLKMTNKEKDYEVRKF